MDGGKDAVEQISADRNLGKLEGNGAGVADDPRAGFDQSCLEAGQRPVGYLLGQISAVQEDTEIVGQCVKLKADGVVARIGCQVLTQAFATTTDMLNAA